MSDYFLSGEGALFIAPDGPNTEPVYLGCHMLGDITAPKGDLTLRWCPDPTQPNSWRQIGAFRGEPGPVTTTITTKIAKIASYLETLNGCPVPVYVNMRKCGQAGVFTNYERTFQLHATEVTSEGVSQITALSPGEQNEALMTFDLGSTMMTRAWEVAAAEQLNAAATEPQLLYDIDFLGKVQCVGVCGNPMDRCDIGVAGAAAGAGAANVLYTANGGTTWAAAAGNPHAATEDIRSCKIFQYGSTGRRILSLREEVAAVPAEINYSDDNGATWLATEIALGTTNAIGGITANSLWVLDQQNIWAAIGDVGAAVGGEVWRSADGGATWTQQLTIASGAFPAGDYPMAIHSDWTGRYLIVAGTSGIVYKSDDGGASWVACTAVTGTPDLMSAFVIDSLRYWVGVTDTAGAVNGVELFFTNDGGVTWTERTFDITGVNGEVTKIVFHDELNGYMVLNNATPAGAAYRTRDGGYNWEMILNPATMDNDALYGLYACRENEWFVAGDNAGSTAAWIAKVS